MTEQEPQQTGAEFGWDWTHDDVDWVPPAVDTTKPSTARIYDYVLGGKDNYPVDREAVAKIMQDLPDYPLVARANRQFLVRAVRVLAEAGIRQFIDLGTGIPTSPNVHEVAREVQPDTRVVYVDSDPIVMAHNRAHRAIMPGVITVPHDLRQPATVLEDPVVRAHLDLDEPVAVLFIAVLHFIRADLAPAIVAQYRAAMAPGSFMAISAACRDGMDPEAVRRLETNPPVPIVIRTTAQIEELFEGFELLPPGLADVTQWRADGTPSGARGLAGVGRLIG
ncbi:MAG: SAM-dependent methyltransferase [Actinobacteria bacterium]|nr:SAM-dependent methyltransferase [Actinomycetota bacterium]